MTERALVESAMAPLVEARNDLINRRAEAAREVASLDAQIGALSTQLTEWQGVLALCPEAD